MSGKKRLSAFTVKEIGLIIKPALERKLEYSLKPIESGEITHVTESEITLNKLKLEVSEDPFSPPSPRLMWFIIGLSTGLAMSALFPKLDLLINRWRDKTNIIHPAKPVKPLKKNQPPKPVLPIVKPAQSPPLTLEPPVFQDSLDEVDDTLSPSGVPLQSLPEKQP